MESRFFDLDFSLTKRDNEGNKLKNEVKNVLISFSKNDADKMFVELRKIKENLNVINSTMNSLGGENASLEKS